MRSALGVGGAAGPVARHAAHDLEVAELERLEAAGGADGRAEFRERAHVREDGHGAVDRAPQAVDAAQEIDRFRRVADHPSAGERLAQGVQRTLEVDDHLVQRELADLVDRDEQVFVLGIRHRSLAGEQSIQVVIGPVVVRRGIQGRIASSRAGGR